MTELALIPPVPHLRDFPTTGTCMLLAQLCSDPNYIKFYRERRMLDDWLVLDNGAFELGDAEASMPMLLALGSYMQCQELVAPDSIMNQHKTHGKSLEAVSWLASHVGQAAWVRAGKPRIMVVPQVDPQYDELDTYGEHAEELMKLWHEGVPYLRGYITLGVSKNMDKIHGGWLLLFREVVQSLRRDFPIQVHCLGLPKSLRKVQTTVLENGYIRSLDTALPFVSSRFDVVLSENGDKELPKRPPGFLNLHMSPEQIDLARRNISFLADVFHPERATL